MATTLHPTAIVEPGAQLGVDCEVMAYAIVTKHCLLGDRVVVHPFAVIGGEPQYLKFDRASETGVRIGAGTILREHVTINRSIHPGQATVVGQNCCFMAASSAGVNQRQRVITRCSSAVWPAVSIASASVRTWK